jgi:hypothetical protein
MGADAVTARVGNICGSARREIAREPEGDRWCFECRKRLPHDWVLMDDIEQPSYYDPSWHRECSGCHRDHTYFPGCGPL